MGVLADQAACPDWKKFDCWPGGESSSLTLCHSHHRRPHRNAQLNSGERPLCKAIEPQEMNSGERLLCKAIEPQEINSGERSAREVSH